MYVCPCIIYENDERYQLDVTIYLLLVLGKTGAYAWELRKGLIGCESVYRIILAQNRN